MADTQALPETVPIERRAIDYALCRIQTDPNVRYYCGTMTQLFALLCEAEAHQLGRDVAEVRHKRAQLVGTQAEREADKPRLQRELDQAREELARNDDYLTRTERQRLHQLERDVTSLQVEMQHVQGVLGDVTATLASVEAGRELSPDAARAIRRDIDDAIEGRGTARHRINLVA